MNSILNYNRFCLSKKSFFHNCFKPYLLHVQINSFNSFIKYDKNFFSIKKIIKKYFPIINKKKNIFIKLKKIEIKKPVFNYEYCKKRNIHYFSNIDIIIKVFLINKNIFFFKKYDLGNIPFMNEKGSFIINGTDRVLISQFIKSYGIYFLTEKKKICKIIPLLGNWLELISDKIIWFIFDKKVKFSLTNLFLSIGISKKIFKKYFFFKIKIKLIKGKSKIFFLLNKKFFFNKKYKKYFCFSFKKLKHLYLNNYYKDNLNFYKKKFEIIDYNLINLFLNTNFLFIYILIPKKIIDINIIINIIKNYSFSFEENNYLNFKGKVLNFFKKFFLKKFYNFDLIGDKRIEKILFKKKKNFSIKNLIDIINKLLKFKNFNIKDDNFDSLENKLILNSGKLLSKKFQFSIRKTFKNISFKIKNYSKLEDFDVLIDNTIITIDLKDYFCNNELSQFLDQNNPLSEISHLRKISLIGNGGIKKENCGFDIRDIHYSHYCKICPIDTPEGHNIGLINSLSFYSKINKFNFISTIYKISFFGKIIGVLFLDYKYEKTKFISNFLSTIKTFYGEIYFNPYIEVKYKSSYIKKKFFYIDLIEISGDQILSVGASLIPFLENNDANRCLMGSNMQRQAVPIKNSENPIVGTGKEFTIGINSRYNLLSDYNGVVIYSDNHKIIIKNNNFAKKYFLKKLVKTNQNTVLNQKLLVNTGDIIKKGELLACSNSTKSGELSLGKNIRVAFMSWYGYNFEDSILISQKLIKNESFSSFHIYEFICILKYVDNGPEILLNECFHEEQIKKNKVKNGIIKIGEFVKGKDVLVGKMCPKEKKNFSPEEKLFKIVFSENDFNHFEQPLTLPKNMNGIVLSIDDFKLYSFNKNILKILNIEQLKYSSKRINNFIYELFFYYIEKIKKELFNNIVLINKNIFVCNNLNINFILNLKCLNKNINFKINIIKKIIIKKIIEKKNNFIFLKKYFLKYNDFEKSIIRIVKIKVLIKKKLKIGDKMSGRHGNKGVLSNIIPEENMPYDKFGNSVDITLNPLGIPSRMNVGQLLEIYLGSSLKFISDIIFRIGKKFSFYKIKMIIKIFFEYIFKKKILIDTMNKKDIYDFYKKIKNNIKVCIHNFEFIDDTYIKQIMNTIGYSKNGKIILFDGITGRKFLNPISVGIIYFMKLNHLVMDKIYSRSVGPYSLITQQPLGGKSNFGGQRLGEMEVWALEAYGSANILKEMLTIKSDDINGRITLYKNIIKGINNTDSGVPESFQVLIKEIKALCLDIKLI